MTIESDYFKRSEFACKCSRCDCDIVDAELLQVLEKARRYFKSPIKINSAHRCEAHNRIVGGSPKSMHLTGKAADIVVKGVSPREVYNYLDSMYPTRYGIGEYNTFVHIDVRRFMARW